MGTVKKYLHGYFNEKYLLGYFKKEVPVYGYLQKLPALVLQYGTRVPVGMDTSIK